MNSGDIRPKDLWPFNQVVAAIKEMLYTDEKISKIKIDLNDTDINGMETKNEHSYID